MNKELNSDNLFLFDAQSHQSVGDGKERKVKRHISKTDSSLKKWRSLQKFATFGWTRKVLQQLLNVKMCLETRCHTMTEQY